MLKSPDYQAPLSAAPQGQPGATDSFKVLLAGDDVKDLALMQRAFSQSKLSSCVEASTVREAPGTLLTGSFDAVVLDYRLPTTEGLKALRAILGAGLPVVIVASISDQATAIEALRAGASDYLIKEKGYLRRLPQAVLGAVVRDRLNKEVRQLNEEKQRQSAVLHTVMEVDPGAIVVFRGPDLRVEIANPQAEVLFAGFDRTKHTGWPLDEIFPDVRNPHLRELIHDAVATGQSYRGQLQLNTRTMGERHFRIHLTVVDADRSPEERGVVMVLWDTTEELEAAGKLEKLAREEEKQRTWLQTVLDQMPDGVYIASSTDGHPIFINQAAMEIYGYPSADTPYEAIASNYVFMRPDGTELRHDELTMMRAFRGETVRGMEMGVRYMRNGEWTQADVLTSAAPLRDSNGNIIAAVVVSQDITRLKETERLNAELARQAEAQRLWLQTVIDQMPEGIHIASAPDAQLLLANRASLEIFGLDVEGDLSGEAVPVKFGISGPDGQEVHVRDLPLQRAVWKGEHVVGQELRLVRADGTTVDLLVNAAPLYDSEGTLVGGVSMFQDITRIKDVDRLKDEFLSIAGHELRTPLTSILASSQLVSRLIKRQGSGERDKEAEYLDAIVRQSKRMARLIEALLDIARLQSGTIQITPAHFDLADLLRETVESLAVSSPGIDIKLDAPEPVLVYADRDRVGQVLGNLLDNAVKYGRREGATVQVRAYSVDDRAAQVEVSDNGSGFDPAQSERMFERFSRLGNVSNHSRGMGLGLYISRQIVQAHGGTLTAGSPGPGQGATFTLNLPHRPEGEGHVSETLH